MHRLLAAVLALASTCTASPVQQVLGKPHDPEFPLPQPLPFNTTVHGVDYDLYAKLKTTPNHAARAALLPDAAYMFNFINPPNNPIAKAVGRGGDLVMANSITMPALAGNIISAGIGFTKACG